MTSHEGDLYIEVHKVYEEMFCTIQDKRFVAYRKDAAKNSTSIAIQV